MDLLLVPWIDELINMSHISTNLHFDSYLENLCEPNRVEFKNLPIEQNLVLLLNLS